MQQPQAAAGRIMGLDLGEKRIGIAISDESQLLAKSFSVIRRDARVVDFAKIARIIDEQGVNYLVVGLPTLPNGREGQKAAWVRDYSTSLAEHCGLPVELWDESFSTVDAESSLRERGIKGKKGRKRVDAVAAAFILQSYLDARRD